MSQSHIDTALAALPSNIDMAALRRSIYADDPVFFGRKVLKDIYWSKQREILESVRDNKLTAVMSSHTTGKSHVASRAIANWILSHDPRDMLVMTSAPTHTLVKDVLWRELNLIHSRYQLPGRMNQTSWVMDVDGSEITVASGYSPPKSGVGAQSAFVGRHARYVLIVFDEAGGNMPEQLWFDAMSMVHNENCRFLAIGNPENPVSKFADVCQPGSGWNVIQISAFDTPNFTGEVVPERVSRALVNQDYVDQMKLDPGEEHPAYRVKVLGQFPKASADNLIHIPWIEAARDRQIIPDPLEPRIFGIDVGAGVNKTTVYERQGGRIRKLLAIVEPDTMVTTGRIIKLIQERRPRRVNIDKLGIGQGVADKLREDLTTAQWARYLVQDGQPLELNAVNVGLPPSNKHEKLYLNLRAQLWWTVRRAFESGEVDIDKNDRFLMKQFSNMMSKPSSTSALQIESKAEMARRGMSSPDEADAVMLTYYEPAAQGIGVGGWARVGR